MKITINGAEIVPANQREALEIIKLVIGKKTVELEPKKIKKSLSAHTPWTEDEESTLIENNLLSRKSLMKLLPTRSKAEIDVRLSVLKEDIKNFNRANDSKL